MSLNATPLSAVAELGFVITKLRVDVAPVKIAEGANDFAIVGGAMTVIDAVA